MKIKYLDRFNSKIEKEVKNLKKCPLFSCEQELIKIKENIYQCQHCLKEFKIIKK